MIVRSSERQSSIVSPQTQCVPLEISQMAKAAMAASKISASANSYQRGDCSAWPAPLADACWRCGARTINPIRNASTPMTTIASTKMIPLCSKDYPTFPLRPRNRMLMFDLASIAHERLDALAKAGIGGPLQQLAKRTARCRGGDRGLAHRRGVGAQLANNLDHPVFC